MTALAARDELLYDTETALRLVDGEVRAMTGEARAADTGAPGAASFGLDALPFVVARANDEIQAVLGGLRDSRAALEAQPTGQQIAYAASVLTDMEGRLVAITRLFDPFDRGGTTRGAHEAFRGVR